MFDVIIIEVFDDEITYALAEFCFSDFMSPQPYCALNRIITSGGEMKTRLLYARIAASFRPYIPFLIFMYT